MSTRKELQKLNKTQLVHKCKEHNLSTHGTKKDLIKRLLGRRLSTSIKKEKKKIIHWNKHLLQDKQLRSIANIFKCSDIIYSDNRLYKWNKITKQWIVFSQIINNYRVIGINNNNTKAFLCSTTDTQITKSILNIKDNTIIETKTFEFSRNKYKFCNLIMIHETMHIFATKNDGNILHMLCNTQHAPQFIGHNHNKFIDHRCVYYNKLLNTIFMIIKIGPKEFQIKHCNLDCIKNINAIDTYKWQERTLRLNINTRTQIEWIIGFGTVLVLFDFEQSLNVYYKNILDCKQDNEWYLSKFSLNKNELYIQRDYTNIEHKLKKVLITSDNMVHIFDIETAGRFSKNQNRYHFYFKLKTIAPNMRPILGRANSVLLIHAYIRDIYRKHNYGDIVKVILMFYYVWYLKV
eukprot:3748_1